MIDMLELAGQELERAQAIGTTEAESGAQLLDEIVAIVRRFVVLQPHQSEAIALWVMHAHAFDAAEATPYLSVTSAEKRSGKSTLLDVLNLLVPKPWYTGRVSAAVLVRKIDRDSPTLLLDESDAAFKGEREYAEALRGTLNTGHRIGGVHSLCVNHGDDFRDFKVYCPKVIAGIGDLPDTVADRSIRIVLRRKAPREESAKFRRREAEAIADPIRERAAAWAASNLDALSTARPDIPGELNDRAADGWEPLLAIADLVGDGWAARARRAAIDLSGNGQYEDDSLGVRLLSDIKGVFQRAGTERISTRDLLEMLKEDEASPWLDMHGKPLDPGRLAKLLKPYDIRPATQRVGDDTFKGYAAESFHDAWARYTPEKASQASQPSQTLDSNLAIVTDVTDVTANRGMDGRCSLCSEPVSYYGGNGEPFCEWHGPDGREAQALGRPLVQSALAMGATLIGVSVPGE